MEWGAFFSLAKALLFAYNFPVGQQAQSPVVKRFFYLLLLLGLAAGAYLYLRAPQAPTEDPLPTQAEHWTPDLHVLSSTQLASLPTIDGFQSPMGSPEGAFVYDAQGFSEWNNKRGGNHVGHDLNGIGGANTDTGMPVYAVARGVVVYSGHPSADWGNVIVLAHRLPDGSVYQSLYAHLEDRLVKTGTVLGRGDMLGTVGSAAGLYLAHLHVELIHSRANEAGQPGYHAAGQMNRVSLNKMMQQWPAPHFPDPFPALRRVVSLESIPNTPPPPASSLPEGTIPIKPRQFLQSPT